MVEVRPATLKDLSKVVRFGRVAHEGSAWSYAPFSAAKLRKNLITIFRRPDAVCLIAIDGDDICGILIGMADQLLQSNWTITSDLDFYAERGGKELLDKFKAWSASVGAKEIIMSDSNGERTEAKVRFFRMNGFQGRGSVFVHRIGV